MPARQHTTLRESHDLHIDQITHCLARFEDTFDIGNADLGIDVDVAANAQNAVGKRLHDLTGRLPARIDAKFALGVAVGQDPVIAGRANPVFEPVHADECLVEMGMSLDKPRQGDMSGRIDLDGGSGAIGRNEPAVTDA